MIVIADFGPLRYLVLIEQVHLLPLLHGSIVIPQSVIGELRQTSTPAAVRGWMGALPDWVTVKSPQGPLPVFPAILGPGEREAIALAQELSADVLLVDDEAARIEAERRDIRFRALSAFLTSQPNTVSWLICRTRFRDCGLLTFGQAKSFSISSCSATLCGQSVKRRAGAD